MSLHNYIPKGKDIRKGIVLLLILIPTLLVCLPIVLLVTGSVMSSGELRQHLSPVFSDALEYISWKAVPNYPTFENYGRLLFMTPQFFVLFWNSIKMVSCILAGQLLVGVPAAWAFAVYRVKGSRALFALYVVLMLLPFQVMMLSSYLVLNRRLFFRRCFPHFLCFLRTAGFGVFPYSFLRRLGLTVRENFGFSARWDFRLAGAVCCRQWCWDFWSTGT